MYEQAPFPETSLSAGTTTSEEPMLRKANWQRFGETGHYRDVPAAVAFAAQLAGVLIVALFNGAQIRASPTPADDASSHQLLLILCVAGLCSVGLAAAWLLLLRTGARALIWAGAGAGVVLALVNGVWLLAQGGQAGLVLGVGSLLVAAGCAAFVALNRHRVDFSATLLATVAHLVRVYPGMLWLALAASLVQLVWLVLWSCAVAYTATLRSQARNARNSAQFGGAIRRRNSAAHFGAILRRPAFRLHQPAVVLLLLLSYCWTAQLIRAVVHATVAGTVGSWYFLSPRVPPNPTARALKRALTTSLGSLCLGALVAAALQTLRTVARGLSSRGGGRLRSCCLCLLGFIDVLVRFFNEFAYTQIALYGKNFTRASRDTWTLLVHHSGVDALVQKDFVGSAMALGSLVGGMFTCLLVGAWARATLGVDGAAWWQARATAAASHRPHPLTSHTSSTSHPQVLVAGFLVGYSALSVVGTVVEAGATALFVCYAEDPSPLPTLDSTLYATFIARPHVPPPETAGCCANMEAVASPSAV